MEKKQTAVEWINKWHIDNPYATHIERAESLMKAKEMEKEQIIVAYAKGKADNRPTLCEPSKYYNKTYGKKTDRS